jgi:hypothetical protein
MPSTRLLMTITNSGSTGIVFVRIERLPTEGKVTAADAVVANSVVTLAACASRQLVTQAATHLAARADRLHRRRARLSYASHFSRLFSAGTGFRPLRTGCSPGRQVTYSIG